MSSTGSSAVQVRMGTERCCLCRYSLRWNKPDSYNRFRHCNNFQAVLQLNSSGNQAGQEIVLTEILKIEWFAWNKFEERKVHLIGETMPCEITLRRFDSREELDYQKAFCFHQFCFSVFHSKFGPHSTSTIFKLAQGFDGAGTWQSIFVDPIFGQVCNTEAYPQSGMTSLLASLEPLGLTFQHSFLSTLPPEIRAMIWHRCNYGRKSPWFPYRATVLVSNEASRLAGQLQDPGSFFIPFRKGICLSVDLIRIFGLPYIRRLFRDSGDSRATHRIEIKGEVTALRFVAGIDGICAIKLFGDDWESDWLGTAPKVYGYWHGAIKAPLPGIQCRYNRCLALVEISRPDSFVTPRPILWDHSDVPLTICDPQTSIRLIVLDPAPCFDHELPPRCYFQRYLSLIEDGHYATGITTYWLHRGLQHGGLIGLEAQFNDTARVAGSVHGMPVYFPLGPNERVAAIWVRRLQGGITIATTHGRVETFGPFVNSDSVRKNKYDWRLLKKAKVITGFYYFNPPPLQSVPTTPPVITELGATGEEGVETVSDLLSEPQYPVFDMSTLILNTKYDSHELFLTHARFDNIKRIDMCYRRYSATGLLLHYVEGPPVVLGKFYRHRQLDTEIRCIFEGKSTEISRLCFRMDEESLDDSRFVVRDIYVLDDLAVFTPKHDIISFKVGEVSPPFSNSSLSVLHQVVAANVQPPRLDSSRFEER